MQLLRDNLVCSGVCLYPLHQLTLRQTLWTSSEAEPSGEPAAATETKDTSDAPIGEETKQAE